SSGGVGRGGPIRFFSICSIFSIFNFLFYLFYLFYIYYLFLYISSFPLSPPPIARIFRGRGRGERGKEGRFLSFSRIKPKNFFHQNGVKEG
ncbi:MAG TPA: hypothetical protein PLQ00_12460, partial [Thermoguttaceae bacterium]|nr:hypothetical protein [Thermoguttaceae bacterium]